MSHLKYPRSVNPELHNVNMLALVLTRKLSCIMWKDFLLGLSSSDAWWRWTITALGSTTAVDIQTTPTSPVSYCWPHWAAHMLPSSLLWLCTRSSTKGWVRTKVICIIHLLVYCVNKIPFTLVLTQITSFFFFPLSADIIWLEHRKDWHECRAPVSAHYALQRTRLCCYTLCLRLGTGHHYCCWHAFLYTGTWPSRNSFSELTKLSSTNITSDCWYSFFQMKVILRNKTSIESWIEEKVPTLIYRAAHLFQMLITTLSRTFFNANFHISTPLSTFHQGQRQNTALPNRGGVYFPLRPRQPLDELQASFYVVRDAHGGRAWMARPSQVPPAHLNSMFALSGVCWWDWIKEGGKLS